MTSLSRFSAFGPPAALLLLVAGCTNADPIDRPGTWQATGANDRNLRAMIANTADLEVGVAPATERGNAGANAATRLLLERRRPLPAARASDIGALSQQPTDPPLPGLGARSGSSGSSGSGGGAAP